MTQIYIDGERKIFKDWKICRNDEGEYILRLFYNSGKSYSRLLKECEIVPTIKRNEDILYDKRKHSYSLIFCAYDLGEKYCFIKYQENGKEYLYECCNVELMYSSSVLQGDVLEYFINVANERLEKENNDINQSVVTQFDKLLPVKETALHAYISKTVFQYKYSPNLIFPFGINETQLEAIKAGFSSQISVIEGPPGTGKTQTILNIIANILINGMTCGIASNNNSAVLNIYEKMQKDELDYFIAKLGKSENRKSFFESLENCKPKVNEEKISIKEITKCFYEIEQYLRIKNKLSILITEIQEIEIEKTYLLEWGRDFTEVEMKFVSKYNLSDKKMVDLLTYLQYISDKKMSFREKWNLLVKYKIFRSKFLNSLQSRENFIFSLQLTYYVNLLGKKNELRHEYEQQLEEIDFDNRLADLKEKSMLYFKQYMYEHTDEEIEDYTENNYKRNFHKFIKSFPVIGSGTFSLVNSIAEGYLFDYVIIDEASQQDLVPGILCLGCAKNVIIVGDRKQLSHIASESKIEAPQKLYDCQKYSLLDSVCEVFGDTIPRTLLKEHYRCHPRIIQFCNKQFYNNQLIPMKKDNGENPLSLIITALGNHMRNFRNEREIDSLLKVQDGCIQNEAGYTKGFIAPYNNQVHLANTKLPKDYVSATIHKFQGRECNEIVFSTVLDKKSMSRNQLDFVDNAELVNVAVSRAIDKFTLVTGNGVFEENNKYIASLIRYIKYYAPEKEIHDSPVISAFDLLYNEHDKSLEELAKRLNPNDSLYKSEQIAEVIIRDILSDERYKNIVMHKQIYLKQLVTVDDNFTDRERQYIKNRASCDFVFYYRVGKQPFAVIEVDGGYHETSIQKERDQLKNSILEKAEIRLLRVRTVEDVERKIAGFIAECVT